MTDPLALAADIETHLVHDPTCTGPTRSLLRDGKLIAAALRLSHAASALKDASLVCAAGVKARRPARDLAAEWDPARMAYDRALEAFRAATKEGA
jgi:hypothetical protein